MASDWNQKIIEEFRANGGKVESFGNAPLLILHTTGAKTGQERESPVLYREQGDDLIVFASFAGAPVNPAWYHNLVAHPDATVELGTETRRVRARVAGRARSGTGSGSGTRQDYPGFGDYEEQDRPDHPGGDPRARRVRTTDEFSAPPRSNRLSVPGPRGLDRRSPPCPSVTTPPSGPPAGSTC